MVHFAGTTAIISERIYVRVATFTGEFPFNAKKMHALHARRRILRPLIYLVPDNVPLARLLIQSRYLYNSNCINFTRNALELWQTTMINPRDSRLHDAKFSLSILKRFKVCFFISREYKKSGNLLQLYCRKTFTFNHQTKTINLKN